MLLQTTDVSSRWQTSFVCKKQCAQYAERIFHEVAKYMNKIWVRRMKEYAMQQGFKTYTTIYKTLITNGYLISPMKMKLF